MERAQGQGSKVAYSIRPLQTLAELEACVNIQKEIWGYAEHELYPLRLFVNLGKIGGHVLGAFTAREELVGFVASLPAWHGGHRYYHSLSLGVVARHENRGLGRRMKLEQRRMALRAGIDCIQWTFDPLRAKNAHLNIARLGAIVRRYFPDYYGHIDSQLQQDLPSDRVVAEWWIKSARVGRAIRGAPPRRSRKPPAASVEIPADFGALLRNQPAKARARQLEVRAQFQKLLARGLAATDFVYDGESARYLLDAHEN